jgi:hypothetical protein
VVVVSVLLVCEEFLSSDWLWDGGSSSSEKHLFSYTSKLDEVDGNRRKCFGLEDRLAVVEEEAPSFLIIPPVSCTTRKRCAF